MYFEIGAQIESFCKNESCRGKLKTTRSQIDLTLLLVNKLSHGSPDRAPQPSIRSLIQRHKKYLFSSPQFHTPRNMAYFTSHKSTSIKRCFDATQSVHHLSLRHKHPHADISLSNGGQRVTKNFDSSNFSLRFSHGRRWKSEERRRR